MPSAVELPPGISYAPPPVGPGRSGISVHAHGDPIRGDAPRPEEPRGDRRDGRPDEGRALAGWLVGPMMLLGTACAVILVTRGADRAFVVALALLMAISLAWILVSVFWPAAADRTCLECGRNGLERLDPRSTRGIVCTECGAADPDRSSFLLAEEEGGDLEVLFAQDRDASRGAAR